MNHQNTASALLCVFLVAALTPGCASVGKTFKHESRNLLELGATSQSSAIAMMGKPGKVQTVTDNNGTSDIVSYTYAHATPAGSAARVLILEFKNNLLNGKVYNSGFPEDMTKFNVDGVAQIQSGTSTANDLIGYLGEPSGKAYAPSALGDFKSVECEDLSYMWSWMYTNKSAGYDVSTIKTQVVLVGFNDKDIVCYVHSSLQK